MKKGNLYKICLVFSIIWVILTILTCVVGEYKDKLTRKSNEALRELERRGP